MPSINVLTGKEVEMDTVHEFTLILEGIDELTSELANTIYAVCDDASVSQQGGRVQVDFDRSAPTMEDAIFSAITDVQSTGIPARVRLDPSRRRNRRLHGIQCQ